MPKRLDRPMDIFSLEATERQKKRKIKRMLRLCLDIISNEGYSYSSSLIRLVEYLGHRLELHKNKLATNQKTITRLNQACALSVLRSVKYDHLGDLWDEFNGTRAYLGQYFTSTEIVNLIVNNLDIRYGQKVLDPACGSGRFLMAASEYTPYVYGIEISKEIYWLCLVNMALYVPTAKVIHGNSLKSIDSLDWNKANKW